MRWLVSGFVSFVAATGSVAQWVVSDPPLTEVATQQLVELEQIDAEIRMANDTLEKIRAYIGPAKAAVRRLQDESSFITNVGRLAGPGNRVDTSANAVDLANAMERSTNPFRREVGGTMKLRAKTERRVTARYEDLLRDEGATRAIRTMNEQNRAHQHEFMLRLAGANDRFESADDLVDLVASSADIQRITAMLLSSAFVTANATSDLELRARLQRLAREEGELRRAERASASARESNQLVAKARSALTRKFGEMLEAGAATPWNAESMAIRKQSNVTF